MRISIIIPSLIAEDAIGQCILHQLRFFRRRGDEVKVYVSHPPSDLSEEISQLVQVVSLATLIGRHDKHFAQSDIYVYHYPSHYPTLESIKGLERGAVILYYHNVTPPQLWKSSLNRHLLQHSIDTLSSLVSYADFIVTDSEYNAEELIHEHGCEAERVQVLPLAVPLEHFYPASPEPTLLQQHNLEGRQVILYVGRMASNKRIDLLVEALPLVQKSVPSARLLLVGNNVSLPYQETCQEIRARADELGVTEDVIFSGIVEEVAPYFRLADVYATASLHEGFGVPLIEAMASGVPVVASRVTSHPWVIGEAGLLVEPDNAKALAEGIIRILTDEQLRDKLIRRGLARARGFSLEQYEIGWSHIVDQVTTWLPAQPFPRSRSLLTQPVVSDPSAEKLAKPEGHDVLWFVDIKKSITHLWHTADVMLRGDTGRSKLPIIGPLIAWIGRHLPSHLNKSPNFDDEPYDERAHQEDIYYCYRLILGRNPDIGGWKTYNGVLSTFTVHELASCFLTSPEFKKRSVFQKMVGGNTGETPVLVDLGTHKQYVLPSDFAVGRPLLEHRVYEPYLANAIQPLLKPGMTFLDIGANIGYFSMLAATKVGAEGRVIAFEPNQYNCNLLDMSARVNRFNNIEIYPFAVAETSTTFIFDNVGGSNGQISEIEKITDEEKIKELFNRTLVRSVKLDEQLQGVERVDIIKIDIEGAEYRALLGAEQLIENHRPIIFSEFSPDGLQSISNVSGEDYLLMLANHHYHLAILEHNGQILDCGGDVGKVMRYFEGQAGHIDIVAYLPEHRDVVVR